ncbi:sulfur transport family protein [Yersinia rochesterensis]|uniref:Sulfur transport family protein n=2 Tax=Yersinia rochesterensis TaxID=1604335 RepID=A0A386HHM4_9GAMM|nr:MULTISPECIES: DUF6691 family protein [Yersinia]AJI86467.1 sulfur transport family protein [Yersinia frederiksenii Y225]CNI01657.1 gene II and x proteins [Yersinia kristensenii]AIN19128.1 sulfur transport family protein [Yersinia rochesterensis]AJJ35669.1 sulfur transport family protein [Yersinia rochesterensis]AYD45116.1 YeeE/YedE family protein [Yersinia rochesterensis]
MNLLFSLLAGVVFGLGLIVAGMANPAKVLGFLDIAGSWDPSLALVMAAAVAIATLGFGWAKKRKTSLLGQPFQLPTSTRIDRRLIGGSVLFGIGWGLAGICPGPALVLLGAGIYKGVIFAAAMVAGMAIFSLIERYRQS